MRHSWASSAAHPPWVVSKGMGGGQQEEWKETRPSECGEGGGRRSRSETAVDESRKEMADREARHKAD